MPRDVNGNYTLPAGNPVVTGTIISTSWANPTMEDIAAELTDSLSRSGDGGMLVPMLFSDGNVGQPSISWVDQPNTGIYRALDDDMRVSVNGVDVARWVLGAYELWDVDTATWYDVPNTGTDTVWTGNQEWQAGTTLRDPLAVSPVELTRILAFDYDLGRAGYFGFPSSSNESMKWENESITGDNVITTVAGDWTFGVDGETTFPKAGTTLVSYPSIIPNGYNIHVDDVTNLYTTATARGFNLLNNDIKHGFLGFYKNGGDPDDIFPNVVLSTNAWNASTRLTIKPVADPLLPVERYDFFQFTVPEGADSFIGAQPEGYAGLPQTSPHAALHLGSNGLITTTNDFDIVTDSDGVQHIFAFESDGQLFIDGRYRCGDALGIFSLQSIFAGVQFPSDGRSILGANVATVSIRPNGTTTATNETVFPPVGAPIFPAGTLMVGTESVITDNSLMLLANELADQLEAQLAVTIDRVALAASIGA